MTAISLVKALKEGECIGLNKRYSDDWTDRWMFLRLTVFESGERGIYCYGWGSGFQDAKRCLAEAIENPDDWVIGEQEKLPNGNCGDFRPLLEVIQ